MMSKYLFFSLLLFTFLGRGHGAVIFAGDSGHTTAPANDPGWNRVGRVGTNGSGIYMGNGWVLTAAHVASKTTFLVEGDQTYTIASGGNTSYQVRNPQDTANVDLYLFRVDVPTGSGLDGMGIMPLINEIPSLNTVGTHIGTGRGQTSSNVTTWYVDTTPQNWVWSTTSFPEADATAQGYSWGDASSRQTRWNLQPLVSTGIMMGATHTFHTSFEEIPGYGMAVNNDSGSPFFFEGNDGFALAGIALSIGTFNSQPSATSMFGNRSVYADLTVYADQLTAIVIPEAASLWLAFMLLVSLCITQKWFRW